MLTRRGERFKLLHQISATRLRCWRVSGSFRNTHQKKIVRRSNYDKFPFIDVPSGGGACVEGWEACAQRLQAEIAKRGAAKTVLVVECYPGVDESWILQNLERQLSPEIILRATDAMLPADKIDQLVAPYLGGDDPVFGFLSGLTLPEFFDSERLNYLKQKLAI